MAAARWALALTVPVALACGGGSVEVQPHFERICAASISEQGAGSYDGVQLAVLDQEARDLRLALPVVVLPDAVLPWPQPRPR